MSIMSGYGTPPVVPPVLYLPVLRPETEEAAEVQVAVRGLRDGRRALLAYTALDRLVEKCGANQPWILCRTQELSDIKERQPFDVVIFDLDVPVTERMPAR